MMDPNAPDHPKVWKLAKLLGLQRAHAWGHLSMLWCVTMRLAESGSLGGWDDEALCRAADWTAEPGKFIAALKEARLLDTTANGKTEIHDWREHQGNLLEIRAKERDRKRAQRKAKMAVPELSQNTKVGQNKRQKSRKQGGFGTGNKIQTTETGRPTDSTLLSHGTEDVVPRDRNGDIPPLSRAPVPSLPVPSLPVPTRPVPPPPTEKIAALLDVEKPPIAEDEDGVLYWTIAHLVIENRGPSPNALFWYNEIKRVHKLVGVSLDDVKKAAADPNRKGLKFWSDLDDLTKKLIKKGGVDQSKIDAITKHFGAGAPT